MRCEQVIKADMVAEASNTKQISGQISGWDNQKLDEKLKTILPNTCDKLLVEAVKDGFWGTNFSYRDKYPG